MAGKVGNMRSTRGEADSSFLSQPAPELSSINVSVMLGSTTDH